MDRWWDENRQQPAKQPVFPQHNVFSAAADDVWCFAFAYHFLSVALQIFIYDTHFILSLILITFCQLLMKKVYIINEIYCTGEVFSIFSFRLFLFVCKINRRPEFRFSLDRWRSLASHRLKPDWWRSMRVWSFRCCASYQPLGFYSKLKYFPYSDAVDSMWKHRIFANVAV